MIAWSGFVSRTWHREYLESLDGRSLIENDNRDHVVILIFKRSTVDATLKATITPGPRILTRMTSRSLGYQQYADNHRHSENGRCLKASQCEPAVCHRFIEEIANGRAEWPRQYERGPEQDRARHIGVEVESRVDEQSGAEDQCATLVTEASGVGEEVAQRRAERLR